MRRRTALPISALALGLALAGCSSSDTDTATTETETATQRPAHGTEAKEHVRQRAAHRPRAARAGGASKIRKVAMTQA